jgi:hypothetical protein
MTAAPSFILLSYVKRCQDIRIGAVGVTIADVLTIICVRVFVEVVTVIGHPINEREVTAQPVIESEPWRELACVT